MDIVVHYYNSSEDAESLVSEMNSIRENSAISIKFNLRDFDNYDNLLLGLCEKWSNIDVLINNASTFYATAVNTSTVG